jgi:hypothetical protein
VNSTAGRIGLFIFAFLFLAGNLADLNLSPNRLEVEIQSDHADLCQVFFDTGSGFSEGESAKGMFSGNGRFRKLRFPYPSGKVDFVRIDPGTRKGLYRLRSLRLVRWVTIHEFSPAEITGKASFQQIRDLRWEGDVLHVESTGGNPAFRFPVDPAAVLAGSRKAARIWWNLFLLPAFALFLARRPILSLAGRSGALVSRLWKTVPLHRKTAAAILLLSPLSLLLTPPLPFNALVLTVKGTGEDLLQVFYDRGEGFNEKDSYKFYVKMDDTRFRKFRVRVPSVTERIRIDPGTVYPSFVEIGSIALKYGLLTVHSWGPWEIVRDFVPIRDIRSFEVHDGALRIGTSGNDAGFMTVQGLSRLTGRGAGGCVLAFFVLLGTVVFFLDALKRRLLPLLRPLRRLVLVFALAPTPLLLFVSSANSLYLGNQEILGYQLRVLVPFAAAFAAVLCAGALILGVHLLRGNRLTRILLWAYFLLGPAFLVFHALKGPCPFLDTMPGVLLLAAVSLGAVPLLLGSVEPRRVFVYFACFGLLLAAYEAFAFLTAASMPTTPPGTGAPVRHETAAPAGKAELPNIYHLILDEFQTDMFEKTLTDEVRETLAGFVFYPGNVSNYGGTALSIPSVMIGSRFNLRNSLEYYETAFQKGPSILISLRDEGYERYGFMFMIDKFYPLPPTLFDHLTDLMDESLLEKYGNAGETFRALWAYANLPGFLSRMLISPDDLQALQNQQGMPGHFELISPFAFMNFNGIEKFLPEKNRYTFIHVMLPHAPYILSADCSYCVGKKGLRRTSSDEQARCAMKLVGEFLGTLKALGRFDDALIVIHADHGRRENLKDIESMELARNASSALLLVKPAGRGADVPFETSTAETMLLDVPATILRSAGVPLPPSFEGLSLLDSRSFPENRTRHFTVYDDKEFVCYGIEKGQPVREAVISR